MFSTPRREERTPEGGRSRGPTQNQAPQHSLLTAAEACGKGGNTGADLTPPRPPDKFERLPRRRTERSRIGARPLLENSTAC
jgi:hypothetical protein